VFEAPPPPTDPVPAFITTARIESRYQEQIARLKYLMSQCVDISVPTDAFDLPSKNAHIFAAPEILMAQLDPGLFSICPHTKPQVKNRRAPSTLHVENLQEGQCHVGRFEFRFTDGAVIPSYVYQLCVKDADRRERNCFLFFDARELERLLSPAGSTR
jgi:hypothetical protein